MRIFVDLEATEAGEVIAIGAVTEEDVRFFGMMAPKYSRITPRITALTGITEEEAADWPQAEDTVRRFVNWAQAQDAGIGIHFFTFGKNDGGFIQRTRNFYADQWGANEIVMEFDWIRANMSNGAAPIYNAFRKPLISLRSAYLTYKRNETLDTNIHNPVEDAVMFKELVEAAESGWTLPDGAELVKVVKPVMPPRDANRGVSMDEVLDRKVIAYWQKGNNDRCQVFPNLINAAKALCTQAVQIDKLSPEQAAYRVLNAAINGETYCNRKFFLVD